MRRRKAVIEVEGDGVPVYGNCLLTGLALSGAALELGAERGVAVLTKAFRDELTPAEERWTPADDSSCCGR